MATQKDQVNATTIGFVTVIGVMVVLVLVWLSETVYLRLQASDALEKRTRGVEWRSYISDQESRLNDYGWIDSKSGVVKVPIERAMERMVAEAEAERRGR